VDGTGTHIFEAGYPEVATFMIGYPGKDA
jgi:hypothetical protein